MTDSPLGRLHINRDDRTPLYRQIATQLEALIAEGAWTSDECLPSDTVLSSWLRTSTMTVRQAVNQLVIKGLVVRIQGRGTFVLPKAMNIDALHLRGFSEDARSRHYSPVSRILAFEHTAPQPDIRAALALKPDQIALYVKRLRMLDDRPAVIQCTYLTYTAMTLTELEATGSLYTLLAQKGVILVEAQEKIRAVAADEESAPLLQVEPGAPLLFIARTSYDADGQPVEYSLSKTRGDIYSYSIGIRQPPQT